MERQAHEFMTSEVVPLVRAALRETAEARAAVQVLADRVETLTAELADGELAELRRLAGRAVRALEATRVEGGVR